MTAHRAAAAAAVVVLGLLSSAAHAQSISSSGALGDGFFTTIPLILGAILGLPSLLVYVLWARVRLGRWPRWWTLPLPLLIAPPLALASLLFLLDDRELTAYAISLLGELGLMALLIEIPRARQQRSTPP